jgi:esterase/lipase superfamily enzyme
MAETTVYFATNRQPRGTNGFGATIVPPDTAQMTYGSIHVTNIALPDAASGQMGPIMDRSMGSFAANSLTAIVNGGENLLVFIHGFDNSFADAIKRAAYNRAWFADGGAPGATSVVAFTWPSLGQLLAKKPTSLTSGYLADQGHAGASGFHIAKFFLEIDKLEKAFRMAKPNGRIFLLAHSMGNWALQAGIASWFQQRESNDVVFDEVFLAAPDERFDTFAAPAGQRLSLLKDIGRRITIYYSEMDTIIWLSNGINGILRLGFAGPGDKTDDTQFPPAKYRMRDCGGVFDYDCFDGFDASHQYYRKSPKVRADIVAIMSGAPSGAKIAAL